MKYVYLCFVFLIGTAISAHAFEEKQTISDVAEYGCNAIENAILVSVAQTNGIDASGLIIFLGHSENECSIQVLMSLTRYYLGSAVGEALTYSIVKKSHSILPLLKKEIGVENNCMETLSMRPCLSLESRDRLLGIYIELIKSGTNADYDL